MVTVSTGCELHCVLRLGCRGPFVLSRGGGGGGADRHTGTRLTTSVAFVLISITLTEICTEFECFSQDLTEMLLIPR